MNNNNIAVIYKSKYGATKRYAGWIALRLGADLYEVNDITSKDLDKYSTIIYGGGLYVGKINGFKFIIKNYEKIKNKNLIIFTVGIQSQTKELEDIIINKNFSLIDIKDINIFNFKGMLDYSNLNLKDKILMKGLKEALSKKIIFELNEDERIILDGFDRQVDLCDKKSINLLIESI